ncbi:MAG: glycogen/starch/alpha-glucan phosphorylase [Candidatus Aureabacteria bacterium]|nr:glycogen/starch/alpha-glucan phosphorylase [Candidatus Auribacterota bacterium]
MGKGLTSKVGSKWVTVHKDMSKEGIKTSFQNNRVCTLAKDHYTSTSFDNFLAMAIAIRDRLVERWILTQQTYHKNNLKRVYYLSMEFLIGRLMGNNIINLGLWRAATKAMEDLGLDLEDIRDQELDAGLGNGGLGRLAACFLDSLATLGIPAHGYGIRYEYGIFNQKVINGSQVELPDEWLRLGNPWEFARPEYTVRVRFYGKTRMFHDRKGKLFVKWVDTEDVQAVPYDMPIPGYGNDIVNTLRLWSARSTEEFDFEYFNHGDYEQAVYRKVLSENISKALYPNDAVSQGRELRLKQEYFFTAASVADILRRYKVDNTDMTGLADKVAIQLNDTHPALAIPELMRIFIDEENMEWDSAWDITVNCLAYTNHTVMPEALETWSVPLFESLLPRHLQIIYEINLRFLREVANRFPGDNDRLRRMSIIEEGDPKKIRMAHLSIVGSHSVNGVSHLHTELLKSQLFKDFYEFSPEKFNNKTNGITQRRWLLKSNMRLSDLITNAIGDSWVIDLYEMEKLIPFKDNGSFRKKWRDVKMENKKELSDFIRAKTGILVNPDSIFDVQVKRIHEYKRQLLFSLYIIREYLKLKNDPSADIYPRTFVFGGKAAPGYAMAKLIIRFINSIADVVNRDKTIRDIFKVVFLENYRVSLAERIFPASELSEQISTAGTEASGTGCMKFMVNGALTIGTLDGANIEMAEEVGKDNIFIFGLKTDEIQSLRQNGYNPNDFVDRSQELKDVIRLVRSNFFSHISPGLFDPIVNILLGRDPFFVCADFESYCKMQDRVSEEYREQEEWTKKSIINVAKSGKFSSDRTIKEYAEDIWGVSYLDYQ